MSVIDRLRSLIETHPRLPLVTIIAATFLCVALLAVVNDGREPETPATQIPTPTTTAPPAATPAPPQPPAETPPAEEPEDAQEPEAPEFMPPDSVPAIHALPAPASGRLNIVGVVPLDNDVFDGRLVLFFDDDLKPLPDGEEPVAFQPEVEGKFRIGSNFISFQASAKPDRALTLARVNPNLESSQGLPLNPDHGQFVLTSLLLEPVRIWTIEDEPNRTVLGMTFSLPVGLDGLRKHLTVKSEDDRPIPVTVELSPPTREVPGTHFRVVIDGNDTWPVFLHLAKGLPAAAQWCSMRESYVRRYPSDVLVVKEVKWGTFEPDEQVVAIRFSKPVHPDALKAHLTLRDERTDTNMAYTMLSSKPSSHLKTAIHAADPADVKIAVHVRQGLPGTEKTFLKDDYTHSLVRQLVPFQIRNQWWRRDGKQGLALNLQLSQHVEAADLKTHLSFTPEVTNLHVEPDYNRFEVRGDWRSNQQYEMTILPGLKYAESSTLKKPIVRRIKSETLPPHLGFGLEGTYYFPRRKGASIPVESRGVRKAHVSVSRMFPSNIAVALNSMNDGKGSSSFMHTWSEPVGETDLDLNYVEDGLSKTPVDADSLLPEDQKGVFCLEVRSKDNGGGYHYYRDTTKLFLRTDIGVLSHWQADHLVVFAHDLFSLSPLELAKVTIYSGKNQVLGSGNTDKQGIARLGPFSKNLGWPSVAVIEHDDDYTFLQLTGRQDLTDFPPDAPAYDREAYDAFLYADRDLYRPGETAHLRWIVRSHYGRAVADVPLLLTVVKPNGRELLSEPTTLSALGTGSMDLATQKSYPTGRYTVQLTVPGSKKTIGTYGFNLEEFVPNRIKAAVELPEKRWTAENEYSIHVNAQHLFGAPASDRKCETHILLKRTAKPFENWPAYRFDNDSEVTPDTMPCGELRTDDEGNAVFKFTYHAPNDITFPMRAVALGRVFELGGRAVAGTAEAVMFPSDIALGIATTSPPSGAGIEVLAAAVRPDGTPATLGKVKITLEKRHWSYYVRRYYSHHESRWSEMFTEIETRDVDLTDGKGSTVFATPQWGYYQVRVHSDATPQYSTRSFYSGYGGACHAVDAARPTLIKVKLDKEAYQIGDVAQVRIESPFDGKGLVVVQAGEIQRMTPVEITDGVGTLPILIGDEQFPNAWVEVTVVHGVQEGRQQVYPFSSFATANLKVADKNRRVDIAFPTLPEEIRPAAETQFEVMTTDGDGNPVAAEVTLAAVDEGIHTIKGYRNPDPFAWLCRSRRPDYRRAHYYDKVAYDFEKPEPGGDLDALLGKRAAAIGENWIKPVALWSGVVRTDETGRATVAMNVPEFTGQLRLVAVACTDKALGSQSGNVFVRRPYMMRTSMPRFLLPGDTLACRAVVFNHTDAPCTAEVNWTATGALDARQGKKELSVDPHGEATVEAEFAAAQLIGQGEIRWETVIRNAGGEEVERLAEQAPIPVRPPATYQSHHALVLVNPGEQVTIANDRFIEDERASIEVTVSPNPRFRIFEALGYVVRYPYGCVEQTTSRLMPMYLLRRLKPLVETTLKEGDNLEHYIQAGIDRLFSMQTSSGGLSTWPGGSNPYPYGSVYALNFLTLAEKDQEFQLPQDNLAALKKYVRQIASQGNSGSKSGLYLRAYAVYVLALGGDLEAIESISRFDSISLPRSSRLLLAAALAQNTDDRDRVMLYLNETPSEPFGVTEQDGTLNSDIRSKAIELLVLQGLGASAEELADKANVLLGFLETRRYGTTQETAFIVTALSGYLGAFDGKLSEAAATIVAKDGEHAIEGDQIYSGKHEGPGGAFTVTNTGPCRMYVNATTRGVPAQPDLAPLKKGIAITRSFHTASGAPVESPFRQAASYVVKLEIECVRTTKNVVVADLLPAGFEIENPRLQVDAMPGKTFKAAVTPAYLEIRDDRLVTAFDELKKGTSYFYYIVRAVTPGRFQHPPVTTECMYDASIRGRSAASTIEVAP